MEERIADDPPRYTFVAFCTLRVILKGPPAGRSYASERTVTACRSFCPFSPSRLGTLRRCPADAERDAAGRSARAARSATSDPVPQASTRR